MPSTNIQAVKASWQFWLLAVLLTIVFLTGGSSRADVQSLQFLRPLAIIAAAYGLFTMRLVHWRCHRHVIFVIIAVILLIVAHLVPLPPEIWHNLPGRGIIRDIDALQNLNGQWRPLSMVPSATLNALYSLCVPIAVFSFAVQLASTDQVRLLVLLTLFMLLSGGLGLLQAIGADIRFYAQSSEIAGLFANRNHQGVLLGLLFPMLAVAASQADAIGPWKKVGTVLAGALALIAVPLVVITGSRAGLMVALLAGCMAPMINLQRSSRRRSHKDKRRLFAIAKVLLAAGAFAAMIWLTTVASRDTAIMRLDGSESDLRYPVWASIVHMIPVYMPWGSGIGAYADVYQILEPDDLLRATFSNHAHNEWLEFAFTAGLPGLAILAWSIVLFLYAAWRAFKAEGRAGVFARLGCALILLLAAASTLDYPVRTPIMASVLAIAAVWASAFTKVWDEK